jgi:hypothetical protein
MKNTKTIKSIVIVASLFLMPLFASGRCFDGRGPCGNGPGTGCRRGPCIESDEYSYCRPRRTRKRYRSSKERRADLEAMLETLLKRSEEIEKEIRKLDD